MELFMDSSIDPRIRAKDLLSKLSVREKLAQITGYNPAIWSRDDLENDYPDGAGQVSFFIGAEQETVFDAARSQRKLQDEIMSRSPHRIPAIFHVETLCGAMLPGAASFPPGIGRGASFDPELEEKIGGVCGIQARAAGAFQAFAPVLDISRDPRFGRQGETYGEDPSLAAAMGTAYTKGIQKNHIAATAKHFLGYHDTQGGIHAANCDIPERLLREVYGKPFQAAITEARLQGVMPCYNSINGEPVAASRRILHDLLRQEMGFQGLTVSDYCAVSEIYERHCVGESLEDAGRMALQAGMQQELPSKKAFTEKMFAGEEQNQLLKALDDAVEEILTEKFELGLFEDPYSWDEKELKTVYEDKNSQELMLQAALESLVLIKNKGILPLKRCRQKIAVIGYHAAATRALFGGYTYMSMTESRLGAENTMAGFEKNPLRDESLKENVFHGTVVQKEHSDAEHLAKQVLPGVQNLLEALREQEPEVEFLYSYGYPYAGDDCSGHEDALKTAQEADIILMTTGGKYGTGSTASIGEGIDGTNINLPECQERLIRKMYTLRKPIVILNFGGRPISSDAADECADAILNVWNPAEKGAQAIAQTLFGLYNPGGKLPVTVPWCAGQIPVFYNHLNGSSYHQNTHSAFNRYIDCPHEPRYYFGHGLSYTEFSYGNLRAEREKLLPKDTLTVSVDIENIGSVAGDETVQLYIRDPHASMVRPVMELQGFRRIHLLPGEKKTVVFHLPISQLAFLDSEMKWKVEKGEMEIRIGSASNDIRVNGVFEIMQNAWIDGKTRGFYANADVL